MPNILVNTNISTGINFSYRYHKASDIIPLWTNGSSSVSPFTFTTSDPLNTNYVVEVFNTCGSTTSSTYSSTTSFAPVPIVQSLVIGYGNSAINVNNGLCNPADNSYIFWFDVSYSGARNDLNVVTSQIRLVLDGKTYYFTPSYASSIGISSLLSNGNSYLGEIFYVTGLNSDASLKNLTVDFVSGGAPGLSQSFTAPAPCSVASGTLTVYALNTNVTAIVTDISKTCIANLGSSGNIPVTYGIHNINIQTSCAANVNININGVLYTSATNNNNYSVTNNALSPNISISVTCS